jgi:hypothetical protein
MGEARIGLRAAKADFTLRTSFLGWNPTTAKKQRTPCCQYLFACSAPVVAGSNLSNFSLGRGRAAVNGGGGGAQRRCGQRDTVVGASLCYRSVV